MALLWKSKEHGWQLSKSTGHADAELAKALKAKGFEVRTVKKLPSFKKLEFWTYDGVCETPCGCRVEPDGHCEHGMPSWLLLMCLI